MNEAAMVTLALGKDYLARWKRYCEFGWRKYAEKCGYDLIVVTEPLDKSEFGASRSPAWQKCLVLSQESVQKYRRVVLLDCDIVINHSSSPPITDQVSEEFVGGVISGSHIQEDLLAVVLHRRTCLTIPYERGTRQWDDDQRGYYEQHGLSRIEAGMIQTGVLVASPRRHAPLFKSVYDARYPVETRSFEQLPLTHALHSAGVFRPIDTRFNNVFYETMLAHYPYLHPQIMSKTHLEFGLLAGWATNSQFYNSFFLHFAYDIDFIHFLSDANLLGSGQ